MKKRFAIFAAAAVLAAAALLYLYSTEEGAGAGIPCLFYTLTGFYCSGCGASRALRSVLHLDFYQALRYNAVFTVLLPFLGAYFCALGVSYVRFGKDRVSEKVPGAAVWTAVGAALVYGILRNIPALSFLGPTTL
ncbi:MAG: DUF2752 domain-containing protein [Oscillospiraceae bacterium]